MVERIKALCKKNGISIAALEKQLGFANGSIVKTDEKTQSGRIQAIANYFHVSMEYLMTGEEESQKYYFDDETAKKAQELFDDPNLRILFSAARDAKPEDLQMAADLLMRLKGVHPDEQ